MQALDLAVRHYLQEVLGLVIGQMAPWQEASSLPFYLHDAFDFAETTLLNSTVVLAMARTEQRPPLSDIRNWLTRVKEQRDVPVVYVTNALASYDRRRLIEYRLPFIVPGNQLYLPDLGIDLREYFRHRSPVTETTLSPSAQAVLIWMLLTPKPMPNHECLPAEIALGLGYTLMTVSRAVKELTGAGLVGTFAQGRTRWLHLMGSPAEVWEKALPLLRSPVKRTVWANRNAVTNYPNWPLAGQSALAERSMLTDPRYPVYAVTVDEWKVASRSDIQEVHEPTPDCAEIQIWRYSPVLVLGETTVDPISLWLSLHETSDERVQMALDELREGWPW